MRDQRLEILYRDIGDLKPFDNNPRTHNRAQRRKLRRSLEKFGNQMPVLIDDRDRIIDGVPVAETLKELGHSQVATILVDGFSEPEIRALRLALNRVAEEADWHPDRLKVEFEALLDVDFDLDLTGFDQVEIDMALEIGDLVDEEEDLTLPDGTAYPVTRLGDLWVMGAHRVLCGDALDASGMQRLMGSHRARMMFTDPPYNVKIQGNVSGLGRHKHREFAPESFGGIGRDGSAKLHGFSRPVPRFSSAGPIGWGNLLSLHGLAPSSRTVCSRGAGSLSAAESLRLGQNQCRDGKFLSIPA